MKDKKMRQFFKQITNNEKLREFIQRYNIPFEYVSANRRMVARGVFIGFFIAIIPMPMQMLAVMAIVPFAKFNVPVALAMCWVSNPFTMPIILYIEYLTGSFLLGMHVSTPEISVEWVSQNFSDIVIPLYAGTAFYSIIGSVFAYFLINYLWRESVKKDREIRKNSNGKNNC
jgi:hypothetical protein